VLKSSQVDLARYTLGVLCIGALMAASGWILRPFIAAAIWATMVVVATWPFLIALQRQFGGRRAPAVAVMTVAILMLLVLPFALTVVALVDHADEVVAWAQGLLGSSELSESLPAPPDWLAGVPLVGDSANKAWRELRTTGVPDLIASVRPYLQDAARWLVGEVGAVGLLLVQFFLIVILSAIFYAGGEAWGAWLKRLGRRLADERGEQAVVLAGQAIRGVALGVIVTALVQSALGAVGLAIAGVPFAGLLFGVMFVLCIVQVGPLLVLLGGTAWLFWSGQSGWGTAMLVWSLVVGLMDNVLRPILIRRGADLPLLLIVAGVIGGLLAFGLVGIFVGPVVLAVSYTLLDAWIAVEDDKATGGASSGSRPGSLP
jgi:predicted PurR-regulated permease PerM